MSVNLREEQISFLQKMKLLITPNPQIPSLSTGEDARKPELINDSRMENILRRIEKIEGVMGEPEDEGVRKGKIKDEIVIMLQQYKKLTASQLSKLVGLSRTRCSEYFRELTNEGKTEGVIINRQKYYKLVMK